MRYKTVVKKLSILSLALLLCAGCGNKQEEASEMIESTATEELTQAAENEESSETANSDAIAEAIAQETSKVDTEPAEVDEDADRVPTAENTLGVIPSKYIGLQLRERGTIEHISYTAHDYFGDGSEITKEANIYLPYGYDESKQYNVLYLMHGIGGDETEWGMTGNSSRVKLIMDNLSYYGDIESFIIVAPNGRSAADHSAGADFNSFYVFGQELRNDLIPYIDSHYSTYAEYDENGYDLTAARDHRAMAGLSMGGMQTINIGIGECVDIISYFGAFSAAPTSNTAGVTAKLLEGNTFPIHYFYNLCGTEDNIAYASASAAAKSLAQICDQFTEGENFSWQETKGSHDFNIWYMGFYNFAQIVFK